MPVSDFPVDNSTDKEGVIEIVEFPVTNASWGTYVAGCLTPGEKVYTDKGLKNIEDVLENDKLINENGDFVDIKRFIKLNKKNEETYRLKVSNTIRNTNFTKEHPILVSKSKKNKFNRIEEDLFDFKYKTVDKIEVGDWTKVPNIYIKENTFDIKTLWNDDEVKKDKVIENPLGNNEFWWFIGMFIGDGWTNSNKHSISIAINSLEEFYIERYIKAVEKLFNRKCNIRERNNCKEITFCCAQLNNFLNIHFGKYALNKIIPEWVKRISKENKILLLEGYLDSDGSITKHTKGYYSTEFVSINQELLESIQDIALSLGIVGNLSKLRNTSIININNKQCETKITYHLRFGNTDSLLLKEYINNPNNIKLNRILDPIKTNFRKRNGCFVSKDNKYVYFKITKVIKDYYTGIVYNFECDTNTFLCYHIMTHNCDPYKISESEYSTSLGSIYIFKRMTVDMTEPYQHMPVAWYTGRPKDIRTWQENVRMLLEFYGAEVMCEANDESFIQYMIGKNKQHYLAKGQSSLREISPTSKFKGNYGLPATSKTIEFWNNSAVIYAKEMCNKLISEDGISQEALGITRILDPMLLEEIIKFNKHSGNYDRIRAFSIALAYANQLDALIGKTKLEEEIRAKTRVIKSPFSFNRISSSFKNNPISSSPFLINKFNK